MILPPTLVRIRSPRSGRRAVRLWLPVFPLWQFLLIVTLLLPPVLLVVALFGCDFRRSWRIFCTWLAALHVLCLLRGLSIEVNEEGRELLVAVY